MTQSLQVTLWLILGVAHSMGLDKCVITYIYYYSITHTVFSLPSNSLCSTNSTLPSSHYWQPLILLLSPFKKIATKYHIKFNDRKRILFHLSHIVLNLMHLPVNRWEPATVRHYTFFSISSITFPGIESNN